MFGNFSNFLYHITDKVVQVYEKLNEWVVKEIAVRLVKAGKINQSSMNQIQRLKEQGIPVETIKKEIAKQSGLAEKEVKKAFEDAATKKDKEDRPWYKRAGKRVKRPEASGTQKGVLETAIRQTNGELQNITRTTAAVSEELYIQALDDAYMRVQSGLQGYEAAIAQAITETAQRGVYIKYPSGKKERVETAVRRALLTGLNQGTMRMQIEQMKEAGQDLLITSQHVGARTGGTMPYENHYSWQGKVFSLSGESKEYPPFVERCGWGEGGGIGGWNCRHHINVFFPGISKIPEPIDEEKNKRIEELNKKQRKRESDIRGLKRSLVALEESVRNTKDEKMKFELQLQYDRQAETLRRRNQEYTQFCEENNLKTWDERLKIIEWNREHATAARVGANRYEDSLEGSTAKDRFKILTNNNKGSSRYYELEGKDLKLVETEISQKDYETAVCFDEEGSPLFAQIQEGENHEIRFTKYQMKKMKGMIVTHNHPYSTPPSPEDLYNILKKAKPKEFRTCGKNGTYVLKYSKELEKLPEYNVFDAEYDEILENNKEQFLQMIQENKISVYDAEVKLQELAWETLKSKYKIEFNFERRQEYVCD